MAELDIGFKIVARSSGREMCRLRRIRPDAWEPIGDTLQTTERLADRAFRAVEGDERFVVYFEAYARWRDDARWNILAKSALLSERERLPTCTLVFILKRDGYRAQRGRFRLAARGRPTQQVWFEEICLWRERVEAWWDEVPGLMALLPLCAHGRGDAEVVLHAAERITEQVADTVERGNLLTALGVFGNMRYPQLDAFDLIGRNVMSESPFYQAILAEGRVEGELTTRRKAVLEALETRFGRGAGAEFRELLDGITDQEQLAELLRAAIKCRGMGGFRRALGTRGS
jgi:hypothetical protein